jgi:hypothetical protein
VYNYSFPIFLRTSFLTSFPSTFRSFFISSSFPRLLNLPLRYRHVVFPFLLLARPFDPCNRPQSSVLSVKSRTNQSVPSLWGSCYELAPECEALLIFMCGTCTWLLQY